MAFMKRHVQYSIGTINILAEGGGGGSPNVKESWGQGPFQIINRSQ